MWRSLSACVRGTNHVVTGESCQDFAEIREIERPEERILICVCADGAGTAQYAALGASTACRGMIGIIEASLADGLNVEGITQATMSGFTSQLRELLSQEAGSRACAVSELACTLLVAVLGETAGAFSQIGDGAIVVWDGSCYDHVFWPQTEEFLNVTNFLTDCDFAEKLQFRALCAAFDEVALFTDGLQMLLLDYVAQKPHSPFFVSAFNNLRRIDEERIAELQQPLVRLLESPGVTALTDDDKTLILATRRPHVATNTLY